MGKLLKQAQKMQAGIAKAQDEIAQMTLEHSVGGDAVIVKVNGKLEITEIKIDQSAVDSEDVETLEDLILSAVNGALDQMRIRSEERMSEATGGMGSLPGMPF